jgi:hypothetical protein
MRSGSLLAMAILLGLAVSLSSSCASSGSCRYNSDCVHAYCSNGSCKQDCVDATLDCPQGYICNQVSQCQPPGDGGSPGDDGGMHDAGPPPDSGDDSPSDAPADARHDAAGDGSGPLGHEFDRCSSDPDCSPGLLCRALFVGGASRCTRKCTTTAQCMTSTRCETIANDTFCAMSDVGRTCSGAAQCNFGCLTGPGYCTVACAGGSDCPNGYGCMPVGNPSKNVCVKAEAYCQMNAASACIAPSACDTTVPVVSGCTTTCNSAADCPQRGLGLAAWTCDGLCRRPADVVGPLGEGDPAQYACNAQNQVVDVCDDAQHIDFTQFIVPTPPSIACPQSMTVAGANGDSCVDTCRVQGGCIHGTACTALGSIMGGRVGLCLPALGAGEVGAACATDGDCFFGYCNRTSGKCSRDCSADGVCPTGSTCTPGGGPPVEGFAFARCQ